MNSRAPELITSVAGAAVCGDTIDTREDLEDVNWSSCSCFFFKSFTLEWGPEDGELDFDVTARCLRRVSIRVRAGVMFTPLWTLANRLAGHNQTHWVS